MGWSTTEPSGASWGTAVNITDNGANNWYRLNGTLQSARGSGATYYLKLTVLYESGPNGYNVPTLYLIPGGENAGNQPGKNNSKTWYYTGSGDGSVDAGLSDTTYFRTGSCHGYVSIPARWTFSIVYNGNSATGGSTAAQTHTSGTATTIQNNGFTRTGCNFVIWNTKSNRTGTDYSQGASYNNDASVTLFAIWAWKTFTVTFDPNGEGATVSPTSKTVTYNSTYGTLPTPTRPKYAFLGWFTSATGGTQVTSSTTVTLTGNQTLYAHWLKLNIPAYVNISGEVHQVEKAYANIGGVVKEVTIYANVGGQIKVIS